MPASLEKNLRRSLALASLCALALGGCGGSSVFGAPAPVPTGLAATASTTGLSVQLHWDAEPLATGGFQVWRSVNGAAELRLADSDSNSYLDDQVPAGATLAYAVRSVDAVGGSIDSAPVTVLTIPGAPTHLRATQITNTSMVVTWDDPAGADGDDAVTYLGGDGRAFAGHAPLGSLTLQNLTPSTEYSFTVTARDATGDGPSATFSARTLAVAPGGGAGGGSAGGLGGGAGGGAGGGSGGGSGGGIAGGSGGGSGGGPAGCSLSAIAISAAYAISVNGTYTAFTPGATPSPVLAQDSVRLTASDSESASATYAWHVLQQPAGSTMTLSGASAQIVTMQPLVAGSYTLSVTATESLTCSLTKAITFIANTAGDVYIELLWDQACGDVDLHYSNAGTAACSPTDCFYAVPSTTWGAKLDVDDRWGYGPEIISQASATVAPSSYGIWVFYYSNIPDGGGGSGTCGAIVPTVNVYLKGTRAGTYTLPGGMSMQQLWNAANVTSSAEGLSVAAGTAAVTSSACE